MPEVLVRRRVRVRKRGVKARLKSFYDRNRSAVAVAVAIVAVAIFGLGAFALGQGVFDNPRPAGGSSYGIPAQPQTH